MKINVERMRYKNDSLSFLLCMCGLICNVVQFIKIYSNSYMQTLTGKEGFSYVTIGVDILYNIIFMLMVFYAAEEVKTYHLNWGIVIGVIGVLQLFRIGYFPRSMMENGFYEEALFSTIRIWYILSACFFFVAMLINIIKSSLLKRFLKSEALQ